MATSRGPGEESFDNVSHLIECYEKVFVCTCMIKVENIRSGTWAFIFGPDYLQVIDSDSHRKIFEKTLERKI